MTSIHINIGKNKTMTTTTNRLYGLATSRKERFGAWSRTRFDGLLSCLRGLPAEIVWLCIDYDAPSSHEWSPNNIGFRIVPSTIAPGIAGSSVSARIQLAERIHFSLPMNVTLNNTSSGRRDWIYHWGGGVDQWMYAFGKDTFDCASTRWITAFEMPLWSDEVEMGKNTPIFKLGITRRPTDLRVKNYDRLEKRMQLKDQARHRRGHRNTRYGIMYEIDRSRASFNLKSRYNSILGSAQHRDRQDQHWEFPLLPRPSAVHDHIDVACTIFVWTVLDTQTGTLQFHVLPPYASKNIPPKLPFTSSWPNPMTVNIDEHEIPNLEQRYVPYIALRFPNTSATLINVAA